MERDMTELEWLECSDPAKMVEYRRRSDNLADSRLRLFVGSCCQRIWQLLLEDRGKLLSPEKWEEGWSASLAHTLREFRDNRVHVAESLADYVKAQREYADEIVNQRELIDRALALARIAWHDAQSLAEFVASLNEGTASTEALRSCAIDFEMEGASDVAPRDIVLCAGAAVLFASADAWADLSKAVIEGQARYASAAAWIVASQTNDMAAVRQAAQAAATAERQAQCDQLRDLFGP
jgi:hypothetical protein